MSKYRPTKRVYEGEMCWFSYTILPKNLTIPLDEFVSILENKASHYDDHYIDQYFKWEIIELEWEDQRKSPPKLVITRSADLIELGDITFAEIKRKYIKKIESVSILG